MYYICVSASVGKMANADVRVFEFNLGIPKIFKAQPLGDHCDLRLPVLDLAHRFDNGGGWGLERTFHKWAIMQEFRQCFPEVFTFEVPKVSFLMQEHFTCFCWHMEPKLKPEKTFKCQS